MRLLSSGDLSELEHIRIAILKSYGSWGMLDPLKSSFSFYVMFCKD